MKFQELTKSRLFKLITGINTKLFNKYIGYQHHDFQILKIKEKLIILRFGIILI